MGEGDQFFFGEMGAHGSVVGIADRVVGQAGEGFRPLQRGAFFVTEQGGFAPDGQVVKAQFALAVQFGFFDMHINAEDAAVDLRDADFDEVFEGVIQFEAGFEGEQCLVGGGRVLGVVQAHGVLIVKVKVVVSCAIAA